MVLGNENIICPSFGLEEENFSVPVHPRREK